MVGKEDTKHVPHLTLIPVRPVIQRGYAWDGCCFVGVRLDADAGVVADGKQVVHDLEALSAGGIIGGSDGADLGKLGGGGAAGGGIPDLSGLLGKLGGGGGGLPDLGALLGKGGAGGAPAGGAPAGGAAGGMAGMPMN